MLGFEFPRNFNAPYHADSITDFWRRWHISLSTFLRDYLYIPLGGNRLGERRTYANLTIVMLLGGPLAWGQLGFCDLGRLSWVALGVRALAGEKRAFMRKLPRFVRVGITFVLVLFSWVLFRCPTLDGRDPVLRRDVRRLWNERVERVSWRRKFTRRAISSSWRSARRWLFRMCRRLIGWRRLTWTRVVLLILLFGFSLTAMFAQTFNPFLYFQF